MRIGESFKKVSLKLKQFMYGRYGTDSLNRFISVLALALCFLSFIIRIAPLPYIVLGLLAISLFRSLSKNHVRRRRENSLYENAAKPVRRISKYWITRIKLSKTHKVYSCEKCHGILRVPKNAGRGGKLKIEIKCPKCGTAFIRRI